MSKMKNFHKNKDNRKERGSNDNRKERPSNCSRNAQNTSGEASQNSNSRMKTSEAKYNSERNC